MPALSGHNQYFEWGPRGADGQVVIDVNGDCGASEGLFETSEKAAVVSFPLVMPTERNIPIMVYRHMKRPMSTVWPSLKFYW